MRKQALGYTFYCYNGIVWLPNYHLRQLAIMDLELLAKFQQIYKDLDLFPLVEAEDIQKFRVDYGLEVKVRLKREIEASEKNG